jgi:hypothetical protein
MSVVDEADDGFDVAMQKDWSGYAAAIGISPATLRPIRSDQWAAGSSVPSGCSYLPGLLAASCCSIDGSALAP